MKSNAAGQLLGFSMQFPRALYYLLRSAPKDIVCIELLGDVATLTSEGKLISEEDKSSIVGNPLTNRSVDLWKTFSNWIEAIKDGDIDVEKTKFVLYCNQSGREGIVTKFSSAQTHLNSILAIKYTKNELKDIKPEHDIWKYYNFVVNKNEALLVEIIQRFELEIGDGSGFDEVKIEIKKKIVPVGQIDFIMNNLGGWLQKVVLENIAIRKNAIITWEEFNSQFSVLFDQSRCRELIDFTMQYSKEDEKVKNQVNIRPRYLRQLKAIGLSDDKIFEAVSDYLRADVNREKWIENEFIDEKVASEFEENLTSFWDNQRERIQITEKTMEETEQGRLLLIDCKMRQETIRNMNPPSSTIAGTYHALADEPILGWHPNWERLFPKHKED